MVIAGNIIRHKGISVVHAIWFVCSKLPMICFFRDLSKVNLQSFILSIKLNLAVRLQRFSNSPKIASVLYNFNLTNPFPTLLELFIICALSRLVFV